MSKNTPTRILIADDDDLVRELFAAFLKSETAIEVVTVPTLDDAIQTVNDQGSFDLVMLDYHMPVMNGLDGLSRMIEANERRPVALISGNASVAVAEEAMRLGAAGFVPKTMVWRSIVTAVKFMAAGEVYSPLSSANNTLQAPAPRLSQREKDVLRGLCEGKSNDEIAVDLELQEVTVKLHVKTLSRKLNARNRIHAAMLAWEMNLI